MTKFIDCSNEAKKEKKETAFTSIMQSDGWIQTYQKPTEFKEVRYLGKCDFDGDMFAAYDSGYIEIFKGIKGSEFDN